MLTSELPNETRLRFIKKFLCGMGLGIGIYRCLGVYCVILTEL